MKKWYRVSGVGLFIILLAVAGTVLLLAQRNARQLIHPERSYPERSPDDFGIETWETVQFANNEGLMLTAWYISPTSKTEGATVIFVHGYSGNRGNLLSQAAMLVEQGYGALLLDLRNHGDSEGDLTTMGLLEIYDVQAALDFVLAQPGVNPDRIGLVGHSMGGATVIRAAARLPEIDAVVAESSFTSLEENVVEGVRMIAKLPAFPFAPLVVWFGELEAGLNIDEVRPIDDVDEIAPRPILFIHGEKDHLVSVENSYKLYEAAAEPKELYVIPGANHIDPLLFEDGEFEERFTDFFNRYLLGDS